MYYEEQWIEGALCWRTSPDGAWTRYTANELAHRYESAEKRAADAQATVEALQRERDHAKKMAAVQKEVADNQTWHVCELRQQLSQLQALVRALPVVSEVTSDTVVNLVQQYSFHAWILRALQLRATLDTTPPAPMDAAETHDRMFNHADRHPEAL